MATVYSLVCWGGSTGKSVTVDPATDYVTLSSHGLRNGTGVAFTSGALPTVSGTALAYGTTYYAKSISANTFELYYNQALTSKINFTSSGSSLVLKSAFYLSLTDKSRWTTNGIERIYDGIYSWNAGRSGASNLDIEVCELGQAFTENPPSGITVNVPAAQVRIESKINGVRTEAYHNGVVGEVGYALRVQPTYSSGFILPMYSVVDGFTIYDPRTDYRTSTNITLNELGAKALNMVIYSINASNATGISLYANATEMHNCIVAGFSVGVYLYQYASNQKIYNSVITKNTTGVSSSSGNNAFVANNIVIGNTTNWSTTSPSSLKFATNNLSGPSEAWVKAPGVRLETSETAPFSTLFVNWTSNNFRPASVTSLQVENGAVHFDETWKDILDVSRPVYSGSAYGTDVTAGSFVPGLSYTITSLGNTDFTLIGASSNTVGVTFKATGVGSGTGTAKLNANIDVGPFEYDLGYGPWPATATVTFSGIPAGCEIRVYRVSDWQELAGVESCVADQVLSWPANVQVRIVIIGMTYRIIDFTYTGQPGSQSLPISAETDRWYRNP